MSTPRDWAWPWSPGYGPLVLTLDAVAVALDRWREMHLGHPRCLEVRAPHALGSDWVRELDVPRLRTTVTFG